MKLFKPKVEIYRINPATIEKCFKLSLKYSSNSPNKYEVLIYPYHTPVLNNSKYTYRITYKSIISKDGQERQEYESTVLEEVIKAVKYFLDVHDRILL